VLYGLSLLRQTNRLSPSDPKAALARFRMNALSGVVLFLAIAAGAWRLGAQP